MFHSGIYMYSEFGNFTFIILNCYKMKILKTFFVIYLAFHLSVIKGLEYLNVQYCFHSLLILELYIIKQFPRSVFFTAPPSTSQHKNVTRVHENWSIDKGCDVTTTKHNHVVSGRHCLFRCEFGFVYIHELVFISVLIS